MAETTYNLTIPHTSPKIYYDNFSIACPDKDSNGFPVCDATTGFHVANSTATIQFDFVGSAIYVYGNADEGIQYTWAINYDKSTDGKPNGNLLFAVENLEPGSSFSLKINIAQFAPGARFQFSKADVVVGTGMTGAQTFLDSYKPGNTSLWLDTSWTANDTIPGHHYYQNNNISSKLATLYFQGAAVWLWGFCGPRGQESTGGHYGRISIDDGTGHIITMNSPIDTWIDHKCLVYWAAGLNITQRHTITYGLDYHTLSSQVVLLDSFDVLRVEGGTRISTSTSAVTGTSTANGSNTPVPTGAIVGGVAGALVILFTIFVVVRATRRKQQLQEKVLMTAHGKVGKVPAYAPARIQAPFAPAPPSAPPFNAPAPPPHPLAYYSAPPTTTGAALQQPHYDQRDEEMNRLRQEVNAMREAMQQQQQQQNVLTHGEGGGWVPPPEYESIAPSGPNGTWQPPPAPSPNTLDIPRAAPQKKGEN